MTYKTKKMVEVETEIRPSDVYPARDFCQTMEAFLRNASIALRGYRIKEFRIPRNGDRIISNLGDYWAVLPNEKWTSPRFILEPKDKPNSPTLADLFGDAWE